MALDLSKDTVEGLMSLARKSVMNNVEPSTRVTSTGNYLRFPEAPTDTYLVVSSQELTHTNNLFSVGDNFTILSGSIVVKLSEEGIKKLLPYTPPNMNFETQGLVYITKGFFVSEKANCQDEVIQLNDSIYVYDKKNSDCILVEFATVKIDGEFIDYTTDFNSMV